MAIDCVFLSSFENDVRFATNVLATAGICLHHAGSTDEADFLLIATAATVLISDVTYVYGTWKDTLQMLRETHPLVAAVLCADDGDGEIASRAVHCGFINVCRKPLVISTLTAAIRKAHDVTFERMIAAEGAAEATNAALGTR